RGKEEERETLANSLFYASKSKPPIQSSAFDEVANWLGNGDPEIQASSPFEFDVVAPLGTKIKQVETRCTLWIGELVAISFQVLPWLRIYGFFTSIISGQAYTNYVPTLFLCVDQGVKH
ncbi:hypothetical protein SOVF_128940, partial [Spinacia oleracea]